MIFTEKRVISNDSERSFLEPYLNRFSETFRNLDIISKNRFFDDFLLFPNNTSTPWDHFLINLILGLDWFGQNIPLIKMKRNNNRILPHINYSLQTIGNSINLEIDDNWNPISL